MIKFGILFLLMTTALANDPRLKRKDWSLITKTENGTVSILKNLSLSEAQKAYDALEQHYEPGIMYPIMGSDIRQRTIIGPDGWDGCPKAFHHKFEMVESKNETPDLNGKPNPDYGLRYRLIKCVLCNTWAKDYKLEWWDESKKAWTKEKPVQ